MIAAYCHCAPWRALTDDIPTTLWCWAVIVAFVITYNVRRSLSVLAWWDVVPSSAKCVGLMDRISHTRSTERSKMPGPYMGLYREPDTCKIMLGCKMHWYALKCMSEALNILMSSGDAEFCEMHQSWKLQWLKSIRSICCWLLGQSWHSRRPASGASTTHVELRLEVVSVVLPISAE